MGRVVVVFAPFSWSSCSDTDKPSSPQPPPATNCENVDTLSGSDQDEYDDGEWDYYEEETTTPPITNSKNVISGAFYHTAAGDPKYAPFLPVSYQLHDRPFSFIREPITIMTSSNGLLCCRDRSSGLFYVCNPLTTECTVLPALNKVNVDTISAVLVLDDPAIDGNYHLVLPEKAYSDWIQSFNWSPLVDTLVQSIDANNAERAEVLDKIKKMFEMFRDQKILSVSHMEYAVNWCMINIQKQGDTELPDFRFAAQFATDDSFKQNYFQTAAASISRAFSLSPCSIYNVFSTHSSSMNGAPAVLGTFTAI